MSLFSKLKRVFLKVTFFYFPYNKENWYSECLIDRCPETLHFYPISQKNILNRTNEFDEKGVPTFPGYKLLKSKYHPCVISQYALGLHEKFLLDGRKDEKTKTMFLKQADWFVENGYHKDKGPGWYIADPYVGLIEEGGWFSAMFQGEAMSVLVRAYQLTEDKKYLKMAEDSLWIFEKSVFEGGITNTFNGKIIYEEYPSKPKPNISLNGYIFALYGLFELSLFLPESKAKILFDQGIESLIQILPFYDMGFWSQYYLYNYPEHYAASFEYHSLHIEQLMSLYYITGEKIFKEYSEKFYKYRSNYWYRTKALITKLKNHD